MLAQITSSIKTNLLAERERWLLWLPVFYAGGIGLYFGLSSEPPFYSVFIVIIIAYGVALIGRKHFLVLMLAALVLGFAMVRINAELAKAPIMAELERPVTISGNIAEVSSAGGFPVLILDNLRIDALGFNVPDELRLSVRTRFKQEVRPGDRVITTAKLAPPGRPSMPGAYDFGRAAYFSGSGANGFAVRQIIKLKKGGEQSFLENLRFTISNRIRAVIPGDTGAMTDAIITGDRSRISKEAFNDMRKSGLAHLIAISGINLVLAAGVMFFGARFFLALIPVFSERYPAKKIAAVLAVLGETIYLLISGVQVSAVRSYIMVLLIMLGVVFDRAATPMRSVALSALIILVFAPEAMLGPSFQMTYAATIALISVYEIFARRALAREQQMFTDSGKIAWYKQILRKAWLYPLGVIGSSLVAGLATAPFSAYHFNQFVNYGLIANLGAIPLTSFIVMPFVVIGIVLMPFGGESIGLIPAGWGTYWTLWIAHEVGNWPNSWVSLPQITTWGLIVASLGGLWLFIWRGKWRYYGFIPILIGVFASPLTVRQPDIIFNENGKTFAINYQGKLYFNTARASYASKTWLKFFGQTELLKLPKQQEYDLGQYKLTIIDGDCAFMLASHQLKKCFTSEELKREGAYNIYLNHGNIDVETVAGRRGNRLWTAAGPQEADE